MKTTQIFLFALLGCTSAWAQTNTFPTTGDVGIGTTTPTAKLHVVGQDVRFFSNTAANTLEIGRDNVQKFVFNVLDNDAYMDLLQDSDSNTGHTMYFRNLAQGTSPDNDIRFQTSSVDRLTIKTNGNVGIGTTNPASNLHLVEDGNVVYLRGNSFRNSSGGFGILGYGAQGSESSPSALTAGDNTLWVRGMGFDGTNYHRVAHIGFNAESVAAGAVPGYIVFQTNDGNGITNLVERMRISSNGNVGIGTIAPDNKLTVKGHIHAEEVKVDLSVPGPDYVFKEGYDLKSLEEVQEHIQEKGHLPNIPSAREMQENGVELGLMNMKLLEKIEELTLYTIAQEKRIKHLEKENETLKFITERVSKIEALVKAE